MLNIMGTGLTVLSPDAACTERMNLTISDSDRSRVYKHLET